MKLPIALLSIPALLVAGACQATSESHGSTAAAPAHASGEKPDDADAADKMTKATREVEYAKMELEISKMSTAAEGRDADNAVLEATQRLDAVTKDRDNFINRDKPAKIADKQLDIDRAAWRMEESKQELDELESMYKKEDFASLTKELVIQRSRKNLEFAQRGLELAKKGQEELLSHELPKKELELNQAVEKAQKLLQEASAKKEKCAAECKLKSLRAENHVDEQQKALDKQKAKDKPKEAKA